MMIRKLISTEIWEPRGLETYLTEMEAQGLRLAKATGWFLYFEKTEPRYMRYRVEYIRHPAEDLLTLYADCGWEYVAETNREVQIFRAPEDADIPEIHTDAQIEANIYRHVNRTARNHFLFAAVMTAIFGWVLYQSGILAYFTISVAWRMVVLTLMTLLVICAAVLRYTSTRRYLRLVKQGRNTPTDSRRYRLGIRAQYGVFLFLILYYIMICMPLIQSLKNLNQSLYDRPLTAVTQTLDEHNLPYFTPQDLAGHDLTMTLYADSAVANHQPFTSAQYDLGCVVQSDGTDSYQQNAFQLRYYDLRIPGTGTLLVNDWKRLWQLQPMENDRFDTLYYSTDRETNTIRLVGQSGNRVALLDYSGSQPERAKALFCDTFGKKG